MTMFTANDDNSMYPKCPRVEITPLATSISMRTPSNGTSNVGGLRYTSISITMMRMIVTIVTLFRLALAMLNVSDASGAAPLTKTFSPGGGLSLATMSRTAFTDVIGLHLADVAGQTQQHICALAIHALRPGRSERLTPEVHHVLHVLFVALEALHQIVVVRVVLVSQWPVGLEDHHGQVRGIGFLELRADVQQRPLRRRVMRDHRSGAALVRRLPPWA